MSQKEQEPNHPAEILWNDFLVPMLGKGVFEIISMKDLLKFCEQTKLPYFGLTEILGRRINISDDWAISLSKALGTTPEFWLNVQRNWVVSQFKNYLS